MKPKINRILFLIYLIIPLVSLLIVIKPHASLFNFMDRVDNESIEADKGSVRP